MDKLHLDTAITTLGHIQRGGTACAYDRMLSTLQGIEAVAAVLDASPGSPVTIIGITENKIVRRPLSSVVNEIHDMTKAISAKDFSPAMMIRGAEIADLYQVYRITTAHNDPHWLLPNHKV